MFQRVYLDAWVMKIFFPIIAALILLCVGSCGYANYCKKPTTGDEDENEVGTVFSRLEFVLANLFESQNIGVAICLRI